MPGLKLDHASERGGIPPLLCVSFTNISTYLYAELKNIDWGIDGLYWLMLKISDLMAGVTVSDATSNHD